MKYNVNFIDFSILHIVKLLIYKCLWCRVLKNLIIFESFICYFQHNLLLWISSHISYLWHQTTNLVFPIFSTIFSQFKKFKKKTNFYCSKTGFCQFGTNEKYVFFFNRSTEKNSWNKLRKTRLEVWWLDVRNKI